MEEVLSLGIILMPPEMSFAQDSNAHATCGGLSSTS